MKNIILKIGVLIVLMYNYPSKGQTVLHDSIIDQQDSSCIVRVYADNGYYTDIFVRGNAENINMVYNDGFEENLESTPSSEYLSKTLWLPGPMDGVMPEDIIYNPVSNKHYVYGNRRLAVVNPETLETVDTLTVSDHGKTSFGHDIYYSGQKLAFNQSENILYCVTHDMTIKAINCATNQVEQTLSESSFTQPVGTKIFYDPLNNRLFWIVASWEGYSKIKQYDLNSGNSTIATFNQQIFDVILKPDGSKLFISTSSDFITLDASNLIQLNQYSSPSMKLLYNEITDEIAGHADNTVNFFSGINGSYINSINSALYLIKSGCVKNEESVGSSSKFYFSGITPGSYVIIINASTHQIETYVQEPENKSLYSLLYNSENDKILAAGENVVFDIDVDNNTIVHIGNLSGCVSTKMIINPLNSGHVLSINLLEGNFCDIDQNCIATNSNFRQTGMNSFISCYNPDYHKIYFIQSDSYYKRGKITIYNSLDNQYITTISGGERMREAVYNEMYNKLFISCFHGHEIRVIDGNTNAINTISLASQNLYPKTLFSFEGKVYVGAYGVNGTGAILSIDAQTLNYSVCLNNLLGLPNDITLDNNHSRIYFIFGFNSGKRLISINHITGEYISQTSFGLCPTISIDKYPTSVIYSSRSNKIYVGFDNCDEITVLNPDDLSVLTNIPSQGNIKYLVYDQFRDYIYSSRISELFGNSIDVIDCETDVIIKSLPTERNSYLFYNGVNDQVYLHSFLNTDPDNQIQVKSIDCLLNNSIRKINTGNYFDEDYFFITDYSFQYSSYAWNKTGNKLYVPNLAFSNASIIQCHTDILPLKQDITWLSFPRLERRDNLPALTDPVLMRNSWYPQIAFDLVGVEPGSQTDKHRIYLPPNWNGELTELKSSNGYKLDYAGIGNANPSITLYGAVLDPVTHFTLYGQGLQNWFGYFLRTPQKAMDAIPAEIYNHYLISITTQYWSKTKIGGVWVGSGKETPLKYGDLVILRTNYSGNLDFWWNNPTEAAESNMVPDPEYFTFEEKLDYVPVYIYTDADSEIAEIGAMADGECIGATVRNPGDTIVEVDTYLYDVPPGSAIEFVTWDGFKSSATGKKGYVVHNPFTGKMEKRTIYAGEYQDYYLASLRSNDPYIIPNDVSDLQCNPNPVSGKALISFRVNVEASVTISISDINGKEVSRINGGELQGGYYKREWDALPLQAGIYVLSLHTSGGTLINKKIAVIK